MELLKKAGVFLLSGAMALSCAACGTTGAVSSAAASAAGAAGQDSAALTLDSAKWSYDADHDVYWQVGVTYCAAPQAADVETMGIYVPGAYMKGEKNADGTYTCTVSDSGQAGSYSAKTAPVVVPVNTPGYSASAAPTEYSYDAVADYLTAGFVYIQPGIRGRSSMSGTAENESYSGGAPWGVTDLKAAVRYFRFNAGLLPGDPDSVYTFGMSGGGAQSALMGATGDSPLYTPYLEAIGAAMTDAEGKTLSDAVAGSMCWCPITSLDEADEAYEWNMGQFFSSDTRADTSFGSALSQDLAAAYADYINTLKLKNGTAELTLSASADGIYQAGTYYDYILSVAETSLNNFLSDTTFPYTQTETAQFPGGSTGGMGAGAAGGGALPALASSSAAGSAASSAARPAMGAGMLPGAGSSAASSSGTTYNTVQDYIASLNSDTEWVTYDAASNTAKISSLSAFVQHCKTATKGLGAFDEVDRGQGENNLFGNGQGNSYHFDAVLAKLLKDNASKYAAFSDWKDTYPTDCEADLALTDELGTAMQTRVDMYNPMYFLCDSYDGCGTSTVAEHWRIRTGAFQSDTALTVESNLALALESAEGVKDVDFAAVWGMKHVMAERTGDSTANFIAWVNACIQG
jgi:hypothetical protein